MNNNPKNIPNHREQARLFGKKEYTLMKMIDYGFWPEGLPLPSERQAEESPEEYNRRVELEESNRLKTQKLLELWEDKEAIFKALKELEKDLADSQNIEKIKKEINRQMIEESIRRRAEKKQAREEAVRIKSQEWMKKKQENILFIGEGYSGLLQQRQTDYSKLEKQGLPVITTDRELADFLKIPYQKLRGLTYHRDVMKDDHYYRFSIPKKDGGQRQIAAPKKTLKTAQRTILDEILSKISVEEEAHGFLPGKSVITGAKAHQGENDFVLNLDIRDFFPSIDFLRVRGLFQGLGYSGYIASLLGMLCTYCERMDITIKNETMKVKTSERILPQGSPASPMITNIICRQMDKRLRGLASKYHLHYTRYADDMSFSGKNHTSFDSKNPENIRKLLGSIAFVVREEGFSIKKSKTRILGKNNRQEITGIVINEGEMGVPKAWVKKLRAAIHQAGLLKDQGKEIPQGKKMEIEGRIQWLKSVHPTRYEKLISQWRKITLS